MANHEIRLPENADQTMSGVRVPSFSDYSLRDFDRLETLLLLTACKASGGGNELKTTISMLNKLSSYSWDEKAVLLAAFKAPCGRNELKTTFSILNKLSSCSWAEKAVLVIAAFALDYGDFWGLAQLHDSLDHLAKSVGITNRVPAMSKLPDLVKCQKVIEVHKLIENTMEVIRSIVKLEKISELAKVHYKNTLATETLAKCIPVHVFWAIITVVACTTQIFCLSSDEDKTLELSPLSEKMNSTRNIQKKQIEEFDQHTEAVKKYWERREPPETLPTKIVKAFNALLGSCIIHGSSKEMLSINVLKNKNVLLFISDIIDISIRDISILKNIFYETRDRDEPYKIVWFPIVEQLTDDMQAKLNLPWYILQPSPATVDFQIMKNEYCSLKNKPVVVVINPQGEVEHPNALSMIRLCGMKAFPFTAGAEKDIIPQGLHFKSKGFPMPYSGPRQDNKIYTFKYGFGADTNLEARFTDHLNIICAHLASNSPDIVIRRDLIGQGSRIASNSGWVVLCKGTHGEIEVLGGEGTKILNVLERFDEWKDDVNQFGFDLCFKNCFDSL